MKCDEQKPQCQRCVKGGRACDYEPPQPRRFHGKSGFINYTSICPRQSTPLPRRDLDCRQQRALRYFRERAALALGSPFCPELWDKHFLLLSEHAPCVRSALIALGSVYEDFTSNGNPTASDYALRHYGKAIQCVVDLCTSKHPHAVEAALVTCILFACLENLRGYYHSCLTHLASGLSVLQEYQATADPTNQSVIPIAQLRFLFVRIDSQLIELGGVEFGKSVRLYDEAAYGTPAELRNLDEAMLYLEIIFNRLQWFGRSCEQVAVENGTSEAALAPLYTKRQHLRSELQQWQLAFDRINARGSMDTSCTNRETGALALRLLSNAVAIGLALDLIDGQLDFDLCLPTFQVIVADAEAFIALSAAIPKSRSPSSMPRNSPATPPPPPLPPPAAHTTFTMTPGCVFPLYFTAARCRHSPTRHRALHLLRNCRRREGLWDSTLAAHVAERLIALEEASAAQQPSSPTTASENDSDRSIAPGTTKSAGFEIPAVLDSARVRSVCVDWTDAQGGRAAFSMQPLGFAEPGERYSGMQFTELVQW